MKATIELTRKTRLENAIENGNLSEISYLLTRKIAALNEAVENEEFYRSVLRDNGKADEEAARAAHLKREITMLKNSLK